MTILYNLLHFELLEAVFDAAIGDDYDGGFTYRGMKEFEILKAEFESRLLKCGYLTN